MTNQIDLLMVEQKEIEGMFLAIAYTYPVYTVNECAWMRPDIIVDPRVRAFWAELKSKIAGSDIADETADRVAASALINAGISAFEISQLVSNLPPKPEPQSYANKIATEHYLTAVANRIGKLVLSVNARNDIMAAEIIEEMSRNRLITAPTTTQTATTLSQAFEDEIRAGVVPSVRTGIMNLDRATGGLANKTLTILGGRPGMGKTALAWQIARNVAASGKVAKFYSLEMGGRDLWATRTICPMCGIDYRKYISGALSETERNLLIDTSQKMSAKYDGLLRIDDTRNTTDTIWRGCASEKPDLVVIDHLRLCRDDGNNEIIRLGLISQALKEMSKALDLPVLCLAQLSRAAAGRDDKRPELTDLRESGQIEENADNVWMLHRPSYYDKDGGENTKIDQDAELWAVKFRNSQANIKVNMKFNGRMQEYHAEEPRSYEK